MSLAFLSAMRNSLHSVTTGASLCGSRGSERQKGNCAIIISAALLFPNKPSELCVSFLHTLQWALCCSSLHYTALLKLLTELKSQLSAQEAWKHCLTCKKKKTQKTLQTMITLYPPASCLFWLKTWMSMGEKMLEWISRRSSPVCFWHEWMECVFQSVQNSVSSYRVRAKGCGRAPFTTTSLKVTQNTQAKVSMNGIW